MDKIKKIIAALALLFAFMPLQVVNADVIDDYLNNVVGPKKQYNTEFSPVYLRNNASSENISPASGELTLTQTDYYLPGRNGLDLEIKRIYKSGISNIKEMKVRYVNGAFVDYVENTDNNSSFYEDRYNLGIGMRFSFPMIEVRKNEDGSSYKFLHTESGDTYRLTNVNVFKDLSTIIDETDSAVDSSTRIFKQIITGELDNKEVYFIEGQTVIDAVVIESDEYSNGQADGVSKYKMIDKAGKKTYFAEDGRVLGIVDRYGNTIKFEYMTYQNNTNREKKLISKITDTVGRVVTFEYNEDYTYKVKPISNTNYSQEESWKESQNPNTTHSGDLEGKFQVVVNLPDGNQIKYDKSAVLINSSSKQVLRTRLQRVYDVDEKVKYHYWYEQTDLGFTYTNGKTYSVFNRYENISQINYVKENKLIRYIYSTYTRGLSDKGSMQCRKIFEKQELEKTGYDAAKTNFLERYAGKVLDKTSYTYTNSPDGYGFDGYQEENYDYLKDTYRFYSEKTDMRGAKVKYTYNGLYELVQQEEYGNDHKEVIKTEHDEMELPKKTERLVYNVANGQALGDPVKKIENFRYDAFGNLTNYTSPLAPRDANGYPAADSEYLVIYSYDINRFHVPILKTWNKDSDTKSQISYTVDDKGNIIQENRLHVEDGSIEPVIVDYQYDDIGNMIKKTVNSPDNTYTTYYEYGIDKDETDHKGAYLTREYNILNGAEISRHYVYNFLTGDVKAEIDANGNRTSYEYDIFHRITKETNPDGGIWQYKYIEGWNINKQREVTDPNKTEHSYHYDIFGNQVESKVLMEGQWKTLSKTEYDSNGNKTKDIDANGHSIRYEYNSQNYLTKKSYWDKDAVEKAGMQLKYEVGTELDTFKLVTVTDEEGYKSKMHYDIMNRLIAVDITPDNTTYYTSRSTYDYDGNEISSTDSRNNTTEFIYDDLNRLVKQIDPLGHETIFTYNSIDKPIRKEEPGNKVTEYIYDLLGRLVAERVYKKGDTEHTIKNYAYDNAGNIINVRTGTTAYGVDRIASDTTYAYDSMNRVLDEYRKIDDSRKDHINFVYDKNGNKLQQTEYIDQSGARFIRGIYTYDYAGRVTEEKGFIQDLNDTKRGYYENKYSYDFAGNLLKKEALNGASYNATEYTYDYRNRAIKKVEPYKADGTRKTTTYTYDRRGFVTSETLNKQGEACTKTSEYDGMGNLIRLTDEMGNTSRFVHDGEKNRIREIDARYYSAAAEKTNPDIIKTAPCIETEYDALNRPVKSTAKSTDTSFVISYLEYDGRGNIVKKVDGEVYNGSDPSASIGEKYEYDVLNRVIGYISAETAKNNEDNAVSKYTKKYTYDGAGNVLTEEDADGNITRNSYYLNGLMKEKEYSDRIKEFYNYDLTGKVDFVFTNRAGYTTKKYMNVFGSPYKLEYPDETYETLEYNNLGKVVKSVDRMGNSKYFEYDPAQNVIASKEYICSDDQYASYRVVRSTYDEAGNILSRETFAHKEPIKEGFTAVTEPAGDRSTYTYDRASRLTKTTGPNGKETVNKYDAKGNLSLIEIKAAEGKYDVKRYNYDQLSRLTEEITLVQSAAIDPSYLANARFDKEYSGRVWSVVRYDYYNNGSLRSKTDPRGNATRYVYDLDKRIVQMSDAFENKTVYAYDLRGNLIEEKNPRNAITTYDYDWLNRLIRKNAPAADGSTAITRYIYDVSGNLVKQVNPNDYDAAKDTEELAATMKGMSYGYDRMNRLTSAYNPEGKGIRYIKYDDNGKIIKEVDGLRYSDDIDVSAGTVYEYDNLGRLIGKIDAAGNAIAMEYDVLDNVVKTIDARNNATIFEYNTDKTLAKVTFADGGITRYEYDKQGRIINQIDQNNNETIFEYNAFGKQSMIKDALDNTQEFKYDLAGNLVTLKEQSGNITKFKYDANNRLAEKRIPIEEIGSGNYHFYIEKYVYDELGNILSLIVTGTKEALSKRITNYTYYPNGLLQESIQSSGSNVKYSYDRNGNLIKTESLRENGIYDIARYEYDIENRMTKSMQLVNEDNILAQDIGNISELRDNEYSDRIRMITGFEYDLLGNRTKVISPKAYGYPDSDTEGRADYTVTYSYDILNRLEGVDRRYNDSDVSVQYSYDEAGNKIKEINEKGYVTSFTYDSMNRLESMTDALGKTYTYRYDLAGNKTSETNPKGDIVSYNYDELNRVKEVIDPYGKVINRKVYDEKGNVVKDIDAKGFLSGETDEDRYGIVYKHDLAGRVIRTTDPEGGVTKYEYNQYGELASFIDAMGNVSQYEYDSAGNLAKVTDAMGTTTKYTYDKAGNKLSMTDGRGKITKYSYGSFGMLVSYTDADNQTTSYKYDLSLKTASMKDRNGNETRYGYNNMDLLTEKGVVQTGESIAYTYDVLGNRETMTDSTGTSTYSYNENNWLTSIEKDGEPQVSYAHDDIGNITSITDKLSNTTEYTYDKSSRMETVSFDGRTITYEYDENGNRKNVSYDGEVEENYTYDKNNRLLELVNKKSSGDVLSSYSYTYDSAGRQISKKDSYGTTEYNYDKAGRVLKVDAPGKTTLYAYDNAGNRISQDETYTSEQVIPAIDGTGIGEIKYIVKRSEYVYSNTNRLLKLAEKMKDASGMELLQKITTFRYDNNGNELRRGVEYISLYSKENPKAYEAAVYSEDTTEPIHAVVEQTVSKYDSFNRLVRTELIKATVRTVVEYEYNGDDLRVEKTVRRSDKGNTAEVTSYLYDRQHVILETRGNNSIRYARGINYIARIDSTDKLSYFMYNGHGDVVQTVSEAGEIENQYDYDIFGNPTLTVENYVNSIRYAGEFYDSETGLYYLRARYYDPYIGRFISEDSYWGEDNNPLSLNLYTYAHNDPIQYIDPSGHSAYDKGQQQVKDQVKNESQQGLKDKLNAQKSEYEKALKNGDKDLADLYKGRIDALEDMMSGSGKKSGSSKGSGSKGGGKDPEDEIKRKAQAQVEAFLTGNESAQSFIDMINAQKSSYDSARAGGRLDEAELYHQRAEILRERLYELESRNGRDISDIVNARGNDAGVWEAYTINAAIGDAISDGVIDSREVTVIQNRVAEYNIALQTGKNGVLGDKDYDDDIQIGGMAPPRDIDGDATTVNPRDRKPQVPEIITTKLKHANDFVPITDGSYTFYGGYQDWFSLEIQRNGGCGPTAAANITAYLAKYYPQFSNLYAGKDVNNIQKTDFEDHMDAVIDELKPVEGLSIEFMDGKYKIVVKDTFGIPTVGMFDEGVKAYAKDRGVELEAKSITNIGTAFYGTKEFIKEGLEKDSPVALLIYYNPSLTKEITYSDGTKDDLLFNWHWVTITSMTENTKTGEATVQVSSWGSEYTLNLNDIYNKGISAFTYFEPGTSNKK